MYWFFYIERIVHFITLFVQFIDIFLNHLSNGSIFSLQVKKNQKNERLFLMKRSLIILSTLLFAIAIHAQSDSERIVGVWLNHLENAKVEIFQRDGKFFGKLVWIDTPADVDINLATDRNNPDPSLRNRKIKGLEMLMYLKYDDGIWKDGKLYSPEKGKRVNCKLKVSAENQTLYVTASRGWFSKTLEWTRLNKEQDGKHEINF